MKFENEIAYFASGQYEQLREYLNEDGKINCVKFLQDFQSALDENPNEFAEAALKNILKNCTFDSYGAGINSDNPDYTTTLIECTKKIFTKYPEILFFKYKTEDKSKINNKECVQYFLDGLSKHYHMIQYEQMLQKKIKESNDPSQIERKNDIVSSLKRDETLRRIKHKFAISIIDSYLCEVEKLDTIDENTILRLIFLTHVQYTEKTPEHKELIRRIRGIGECRIQHKYNLSEERLEKKLEKHKLNAPADNSEKLKNVFALLPKCEEWRMFVDRLKQKEGWKEYEQTEPGCINAMSKAWDHIKETIDEELTLEYIIEVHKIASSYDTNENSPGKLYGCAIFKIPFECMTMKGFFELTENEQLNKRLSYNYTKCIPYLTESMLTTEEIAKEIQAKIDAYNVGLKNASTSKEKITLMLELFRGMELLHTFADCNCRTFFTLLLNRELIKIGFPFAIFDNPNRLDGFDINACIEEIIKGFENFEQVRNSVPEKGFKTTEELLALGDKLPITEEPSSWGSWVVSYISTLRSRCSLM